MPGSSHKPPAPPVLDCPAPGATPAGSLPQNPASPTGDDPRNISPPVLNYPPPDARPAPPAGGQTAALAARVIDLLRANGLRLSGPLSQRLRPGPALSGSLRLPGARRYWWLYLLSGLAGAALVLRLGAALAGALADPLTTLQYGQVRTTHLSVYFGLPGETSTSPSLITATNDHGVGHIWMLPAGHAAQASVLEIPLTDIDPDGRLPLHLAVADVDRDGHPDLLVTPGDGPGYVYLLDTGKVALRPPTPGEQQRLFLPGPTH